MRPLGCIAVAISLVFSPSVVAVANAEDQPPRLIAEFAAGGAGSLWPGPAVSGVVFTLEYGSGSGIGVKPYGIDAELEVGSAAGVFVTGQTGTFDFSAANSSDFAAFVARLTDGSDESLVTGNRLPREGSYPLGGAGGGLESQRFNSTRDLVGVDVRLIRLIVNHVYVATSADGWLEFSTSATWQIWGTVPGGLPPLANAGPDVTITGSAACATLVTLDAAASFDPNNDPIRHIWTGPFGTFIGERISMNLTPGTYSVSLRVHDDRGESSGDEVIVVVEDPVVRLTSERDAARMDAAAAQAALASMEHRFIQRLAVLEAHLAAAYKDPTFAVPGASIVEKYDALLDAITALNLGRTIGLREALAPRQ